MPLVKPEQQRFELRRIFCISNTLLRKSAKIAGLMWLSDFESVGLLEL
jgi:hypothetical protein